MAEILPRLDRRALLGMEVSDEWLPLGFVHRLKQAGAPVTGTAAMMPNRNDEYLVSFQGIDDRIGKAFDGPSTNVKRFWTSGPRMLDHELASRLKCGEEPFAIPASLTFEVSSSFDDLRLSLVVQFAGHHR
jgi:hypothetical protein